MSFSSSVGKEILKKAGVMRLPCVQFLHQNWLAWLSSKCCTAVMPELCAPPADMYKIEQGSYWNGNNAYRFEDLMNEVLPAPRPPSVGDVFVYNSPRPSVLDSDEEDEEERKLCNGLMVTTLPWHQSAHEFKTPVSMSFTPSSAHCLHWDGMAHLPDTHLQALPPTELPANRMSEARLMHTFDNSSLFTSTANISAAAAAVR